MLAVTGGVAWLIGTGFALITVIGGIIARDRQLTQMIAGGDEKLHERINRINDKFVRRDDLDVHIKHMEASMKEMREEQRETNKRLDVIISTQAGGRG